MPNVEVVMCEDCKSMQLAPAVICRQCGAGNVKSTEISGKGMLYTYTTIHVPPENWDKPVPYIVGVLRLKSGLLLTASYAKDSNDNLELGDEFDVCVEDGRFVFQ